MKSHAKMGNVHYTVNSSVVHLFIRYMTQTQLDDPELLSQLHQFLEQPHVSDNDLNLILCAIETKRPRICLGLEIGQYIEPMDIGVFGYLLQNATTPLEMLRYLEQFEVLLHTLPNSRVIIDGTQVTIVEKESIDTYPLVQELYTAGFVTLLRKLLVKPNLNVTLHSRTLEPPKQQTDLYKKFFGCAPVFGAPFHQISFDLSRIGPPLTYADHHLKEILLNHARLLVNQNQVKSPLLQEIQDAIESTLAQGQIPTLTTIAQHLNTSERTLYRLLKNQNLNYQSILDDTRYSLAKNYLANPQLPIAQIAHSLGYTEQSSFTRAFASWAGVPPLQYRKNALYK